ncbi:MAG: hypothetical protein V4808_10485 [Pseudomonadota bacterium]
MSFFLAGVVSALLTSGAPLVPEMPIAAEAETSVYHVSMKLHDGTQLIASPILDVKVGELATVSVDDGKGQRYLVRLSPMRASGKVFMVSSIDVASNDSAYFASPALMVGLGEASAIELGKEDVKSKPFRLDVTLTSTTAPTL